MNNWKNYFVPSKNSRLIQNHIDADDLYQKILDHDGSTAYCCYFDLDEAYLKHEWDTGKTDHDGKKIYEYTLSGVKPSSPNYQYNGKSFAKYEGICKPALDMVSFDFDSEDPEESLQDVRRFVQWLDIEDAIVFFSGSKGFHVMVPFGYFPLQPNEHLPNQLKDLAKHLKDTYPTLDDSIYNYNRKFRVPFSRHEKSGLYKVLIDYSWSLSEIILEAEGGQHPLDFLEALQKENHQPLIHIATAIEESKRKSYEIERDKAGNLEKPSPFEAFDNKLCIEKMKTSRCDDIGRNNAALRIVNDYYRTGKTRTAVEKDLMKWASDNGLPLSEINTIISNIYDRAANYNFGCQDECKSLYCSAKCEIWKKLDPDKRPTTVDMPKESDDKKYMANEFKGVIWLMENVFQSYLGEDERFSMGLVVKQDSNNLFYYKDKHWQLLTEDKIHILKTKLNAAYENKLSTRKLDSVFKMFVMYVPQKPDDVDLFAPRTDMANFLDGTLKMVKTATGSYKLQFEEHSKMNFCTTIIDLKYEDYLNNKDRVNEKFDSWLKEFLVGDMESYHLIQEMYGASIMPRFPQFFVLIGKSGTGKSTTIKVLKKLHQTTKNISGVSPDKFNGFHMASMVGKLMNIVSDIKTNCRIDDDTVKQVDDQEEVRIEVKGKQDIYTRLPALHIFGANSMPKTSEGYSGAMKRRFSMVNFNKVYEGKRNYDIAEDMYNHDPLGILSFALRGLERLIEKNGGEYTRTKQSQENVDEWTKTGDVFQTFLIEAVEDGIDVDGEAIKLNINPKGFIQRSDVWKSFNSWQVENLDKNTHMGKMNFFQLVRKAGYEIKRRSEGVLVFGIQRVDEGSEEI